MTTPLYKSGTTVPVTVPLPVNGGVTLTPSAVNVVVHDESGVVIATISPDLPISPATELTFEIPADKNLLDPMTRKGARQVEVTFTAGTAVYIEVAHYLIENSVQLSVLVNTWQTYPEALMTRSDLAVLHGWDAASDSLRISALNVAHTAMCNLRYRYRLNSTASQRRLTDFPGVSENSFGQVYATVTDPRNILAWEWAEYPDDFKTALKRAQLVEADTMLAGDPIGDKRRAGIVSETIGESSMFLRQVPEAQFAISRAALNHLRGFVTFTTAIARA